MNRSRANAGDREIPILTIPNWNTHYWNTELLVNNDSIG